MITTWTISSVTNVANAGDLHDGAGLSDTTTPDGEISIKIFDDVDYDLLAIGNHELYLADVAYQTLYVISGPLVFTFTRGGRSEIGLMRIIVIQPPLTYYLLPEYLRMVLQAVVTDNFILKGTRSRPTGVTST
jgi:hypothetical protein